MFGVVRLRYGSEFIFGIQSVSICFVFPKTDIPQVKDHVVSTSGISRVTVWFVTSKLDLGQVHQKPTSNYGSWAVPMWVVISKLYSLSESRRALTGSIGLHTLDIVHLNY
jgi:hypothetical protein